MATYCDYYRTASPADTGKAAVCFFERQWPGAADPHVSNSNAITRKQRSEVKYVCKSMWSKNKGTN